MPVEIMPSLLSADFARLADEIGRVPSAEWLHVDVMDNHFVPNLTIGRPVVEALSKATDKRLDCHLMIDDPERWAKGYVEAGAASVTFHIEASDDPVALARELRAQGARAGVAFKPATDLGAYESLVPEVDMLLVMTVEPGFGGQEFLEECVPKIKLARELAGRHGGDIWVQVDGGISAETIEQCAEAGATMFVAGSAVFGADDPDAMVRELKQLAADAL
jgi:ribulose-phosphate 3-epimerase